MVTVASVPGVIPVTGVRIVTGGLAAVRVMVV